MKGGDRAYTRGPSLGWLFAKCCCCLSCRGEWLSAFAPSFSQRLGRLNTRWGGGDRRGGRNGERECGGRGKRRGFALYRCTFQFPRQNAVSLSSPPLSPLGEVLTWIRAAVWKLSYYLSATLDVWAPACSGVGADSGAGERAFRAVRVIPQ